MNVILTRVRTAENAWNPTALPRLHSTTMSVSAPQALLDRIAPTIVLLDSPALRASKMSTSVCLHHAKMVGNVCSLQPTRALQLIHTVVNARLGTWASTALLRSSVQKDSLDFRNAMKMLTNVPILHA
jgi:hypothetical protein